MQARILGPGDFRSMPWKNGRGTTSELAREDDAAGVMLWRLSSADVVEAGDFSPFPGVDRILMLTEGEGFDLDFGEHCRAAAVERLVPIRFSGDWSARAANLRGPSRDLNVMVARGRASADVTVHREAGPFRPLADRSLFLAIAGDYVLALGGETLAVQQSQLLVVSRGRGLSGKISGGGVLVQVEIALKGRAHGSDPTILR